ncbi:AraC family transcriptional regulator [Paenibacillus montaniterrae]|uniref:AraC family transcriptional regulator n=1 Tax=Paenibacillus montaniterrae TaxID=429341 RepID=A0A920CT43_9BACL|nr:AraC family transcriptional regulator [Paenibacillus montaniterrae]GIP15472.1 AraC family transcriptional regulator [Paenibacillus montaniterrae]
MEATHEIVPYDNPLLSIRIFQSHRGPNTRTEWHYHKQLELLLVLNGQLDLYMEADMISLVKNDVAILGAYELHRDYCSTALEYIVVQFDLEHFFDQSSISYMRYFSETHEPLSRTNYIFKDRPHIQDEVSGCIRTMLREADKKEPGYEIAVSILIKQILLLLLRNDSRKVLSEQDPFDKIRLKPVLDYVEQHLTDRIAVEEVCQIANMSYYYFVKFFKKSIGLSFTEYVNYRKVKRAERLLLTKDLSITEIGEKIGMPNMAHFYKMFKKYNDCSPKQYQKKMLQWKSHEH